jgi:glutathione S-transferase
MKLYGVPPTRALRPIWLLNELCLDCDILPIDLPAGEHRHSDFLAINPMGKVPVLVDGDFRITESAAISLYLAERYGGGQFISGDLHARSRMVEWMFFLVTEIEQPLWRIALHSVIDPEAERRANELPLAERDCRAMLVPLDAHMTGREWFVGIGPSVADFIAAFTLDWADEQGFLDTASALKAFVERMYARERAPLRIAEAFAALQAGGSPRRLRRAA